MRSRGRSFACSTGFDDQCEVMTCTCACHAYEDGTWKVFDEEDEEDEPLPDP